MLPCFLLWIATLPIFDTNAALVSALNSNPANFLYQCCLLFCFGMQPCKSLNQMLPYYLFLIASLPVFDANVDLLFAWVAMLPMFDTSAALLSALDRNSANL
jgi:hypothetical protein